MKKIETPADLKAWRKRMKLTQPEAAEMLRCGLRTYKEWELGTAKVSGPACVACQLLEK